VNETELMAVLRAVLPPVPDRLLTLGYAAFTWFEPTATLAALTAESTAPAGVRGAAPRRLTFAAPSVSVEIEMCDGEIVGQLSPPSPAEVLLRSPRGERDTRTDEAGAFALCGVPAGPFSLLFRLGDASSVVTSWIVA
jgi:hypothetical protein